MAVLKLYMLFIAISFLVGLSIYFFRKNVPEYLKLLPPFLLLTLLVELLGAYLASVNKNNLLLYNLFTVFSICFYLFIIKKIINNIKVKKIINIATALYAVIALVNIFYIQGVNTFHTVTFALGCLLLVVFCIYYFFELFTFPKSMDLKKNPAFWICCGLLFFYACSLPLYGFINFWMKFKFIVANFLTIITILNLFLYTLFTIAFLCVRTRKYTLSSS
jgi:hypothetical protein